MFNYRKATDRDREFLDALLILSHDNHEIGVGYPRGDLEDVEFELAENKQTVNDSFYIIEKENMDIGIIGEIRDDNYLGLVGPIFSKDFHQQYVVYDFLDLFLKKQDYLVKKIGFHVVEDNIALATALDMLGAIKKSTHIAMFYEMNNHNAIDITSSFIEIAEKDNIVLKEIAVLFKKNMFHYGDVSFEDLLDYIDKGYRIFVAKQDNKIVGAIIWGWFHNLHFGRVEYICVDQNYRRQGLALNLLNNTLATIRKSISFKEDLNLFHLDLKKENVDAFQLYKKVGFKLNYYSSVYRINLIKDKVLDENTQ